MGFYIFVNERGEYLEEIYLFHSSLTLFVLGCLALALSIFFRLRSNALSHLPENLSANVFDRSFVVLNPYSERRRIIRGFLSVLPMAMFLAGLGVAIIVWKIIESGLALSLLILVVGLNLIIVEDASEIYQNSRAFIEAVQSGSSLGVGDLKGFQVLRDILPRIIKYYLGLSIVLIAFSLVLPYVWSSALRFFAWFIGSIVEVGPLAGLISFQVAVFLFGLTAVAIQIFASKIKNKLIS